MTPYEYIIKYQNSPFYHFAQYNMEWIISPSARLYCGHYHGIYKHIEKDHWLYDSHIRTHSIRNFVLFSKPNKNYMLPTKENLQNTYRDFPNHRLFLKSLFGNLFLTEEMLQSIEKDYKIDELERKIEIYKTELMNLKNKTI